MSPTPELRAVVFDIGDTLVRAAAPGTPVDHLRAVPIGRAVPHLRALAGRFRLAAVTDTAVMTGPDVRAALAGTGLDELLEVIVTSHDVGVAKPDPRGLRQALDALGVAPHQALMVGDSPVDRGAADAAGIAFEPTDPVLGPGEAVRRHLGRAVGPAAAALALVGPLDDASAAAADRHQAQLTKPPGSLGRVEDLGSRLAAMAGACPPPVPSPAAVAVFAGDHGVLAEGVTHWPQEVTGQMVANFVAGGAAVNVLARQVGASVTVVDVGVAADLDALGLAGAPGLRRANVSAGTANLAAGPAMSPAEVRAALDVGAAVADDLITGGARCLVTGEMGIGNTTPAAALIAAFTGGPPADVTGRGTGVDDATLATKVKVVERAVARLDDDADPITVLAEVGGLEIAALAGYVVGGASHGVPVVVDGVIALAGLLAASAMSPAVTGYVVAGHRSTEPGASVALHHLGLEPLLDLGLRLGEGTGAVLALPVVEGAARVLSEMATFDTAGIVDDG